MANTKNKAYISPSPTRTSIKEANDHLQLLYQKVIELEKTVKDQAEALMRKDEYMQTKLRELAEAKDFEIEELQKKTQLQSQKLKKMEETLKEKESQIETLNERISLVDEVSSYIPIVERLLSSLKKLPTGTNSSNNVFKINSVPYSNRPKNRSTSRSLSKLRNSASGPLSSAQNHNANQENSIIDSHSVVSQISDLKIGRSFNINRNFSMSEDEGENGQV